MLARQACGVPNPAVIQAAGIVRNAGVRCGRRSEAAVVAAGVQVPGVVCAGLIKPRWRTTVAGGAATGMHARR